MKNYSELTKLIPPEQKALMSLVTMLRHRFPDAIRHVMLFGSKIRGNSDPESDIDLLIVVDDYSWSMEKEITHLATQTDHDFGVLLSDHVISISRFRQMAARREPFYKNLEREGIDLWQIMN